ncbi:DUF748 domain-containing protein [Sulfurisoma sediminicola]|uniref:Uncharacterized protein DUF748 n=1 Tax=Sulfurisoma sediminicola TaxID=1381557 RepID=A0A497XDE2_9PROT|nr:DUF748 domain-containing protein [Sulfurisoma sediminicola]RLJ64990.1 uncharacterized protein DUF748 [Sulfurisoma sediminicola]
MIKHIPRKLKISLAVVAGLSIVWLLFAWLALPPLLQSQAIRFVAEKTGHRLRLDAPEFNPFELRLRLRNFALQEPGGAPLLAFRELELDLSSASIVRRAWVFDAVRLEGLSAALIERSGDKLNWSAFLAALKSKEDKPDEPLPRLEIRSFVLVAGRLEVADQRTPGGFTRRIEPIDIELKDLSTLPNAQGSLRLAARTGVGEKLEWEGRIILNPLALAGHISVADVDLSRLAPLVGDVLPIAPPQGKVQLAADYRVTQSGEKLDFVLDRVGAKVTGLRLQRDEDGGSAVTVETIEARDGQVGVVQSKATATLGSLALGNIELEFGAKEAKSVQLGNLALSDVRVDLGQRTAMLGHALLGDGRIRAVRAASGRVNVIEGLKKFLQWRARGAPVGAEGEGGAPSWRYRIEKAEVAGFAASFRDETLTPPAEIAIEEVGASIEGISEDLKAPRPLTASFRARDGGRFEARGIVAPVPFVADIQVKLSDLALKLAQPYVSATTTVDLRGGAVSTEGRATYGARGPAYRGGFAVRDLRVNEGGSDRVFVAWKALRTGNLQVTPARLDIGDLVLDGLDTNLVIEKDKSVNVAKIMKKPPAAEAPATPAVVAEVKAPEPPPAALAEAKVPDFAISIERLRVTDGEMDFADHSLVLPFATRIVKLNGAINGLSSRPGAPGQVEIDGQVDDYGLARVVGQINVFKPGDFTDLKVVFRNVEMTRLTPYTATFAGRKIDSGKLSLDLEYKIAKRQLQGDNKVVMEKLVLGERVDTPGAQNLPLDLAIAILQDSDGRIDLGLPVSGSLDDPQFSYGQIVWKAIVNVLTKIVTAPFRALGALFGGGEQFDSIAFEAGSRKLTPPEQEKLVRLAGALNKRPGLGLGVHGTYAPADRIALQDLQLRQAVAVRSGQGVEGQSDPGPLSTGQPKVQAALESLFAERFGGGELAALKDGFRRANPGQLEEGAAGKMVSRLASLVREQRTLGNDEVARLKGANFHAELFLRLREKEVVAEQHLVELGKTRGEAIVAGLRSAGAPAERIELRAPEKLEGDLAGRDIPVKLVVNSARKGSS